MRRLIILWFWIYAALNIYVAIRALLGFPFQLIMAFLLPLFAFGFALLHGALRWGWGRAVLFLSLALGISLFMEGLGVATGWIFGAYHYTPRFGPLFLGLVPYMIPISWFMMLYPSFIIATLLIPPGWNVQAQRLSLAALGGLVMTSWDLVVDPLMTARGHWIWETRGAYFGIPLQNYWGWWLTSFLILSLFAWWGRVGTAGDAVTSRIFDALAVIVYAITGLGNVLDALLASLAGPALIALAAISFWTLFAVWRILQPPQALRSKAA